MKTVITTTTQSSLRLLIGVKKYFNWHTPTHTSHATSSILAIWHFFSSRWGSVDNRWEGKIRDVCGDYLWKRLMWLLDKPLAESSFVYCFFVLFFKNKQTNKKDQNQVLQDYTINMESTDNESRRRWSKCFCCWTWQKMCAVIPPFVSLVLKETDRETESVNTLRSSSLFKPLRGHL